MMAKKIYRVKTVGECTAPYFAEGVAAGFPSPAQGYVEEELDLNELLVKNRASTYFVKARGESMRDAIQHEDLLIVDKSLTPHSGDIIVAAYYGEFLVKEYVVDNESVWLLPFNESYQPIQVKPHDDFSCFGVVTCAIHRFRA